MRSARVFLLLGLIAAAIIVLLVSSEVAALDLAETSTESGVNDVKHDEYGGGYPGRGYPGGRGGGYPGRGGRCRYGCCGSGYNGRCRCCASAAEAEQKEAEVKPQN